MPSPDIQSANLSQRRRVPGEADEEAGEGEVNGEGEATEKPKRKPRTRKPKQPKEARIDGAEGDAAAPAEGQEKSKRAKKPRQPKLALTGELSKVRLSIYDTSGQVAKRSFPR